MSEPRNMPRLEEAAYWFAKHRRGLMTLEERKAYNAWRSESLNAAQMAELERVWAVLDRVQGQARIETAMPARSLIKYRRPALFAVMCAVSLGLGVLSYSGDSGFWTNLDWVER